MFVTTRLRLLVAGFTAAAALVLGLPAGAAQAATGDIGFEDGSYSGTSQPASADKPESKLWWAGSSWWAVMFNATSAKFDIFRLDRSTNTWVDTGVLVDSRTNTLADAQWDPGRNVLSIASHVATTGSAASGKPANLMRYSLSGSTWTKLSTVQIANFSSESMTIDVDSTGAVWATWTQATSSANAVYVAHNTGGSSAFGTPFLAPSADANGNKPDPDDISTIVAFNGRIGVLWSNQLVSKFYWSVHTDGAVDGTWAKAVAFSSPSIADDHLNIKSLQSDSSGRVFAALKTSINDTSTDKTQPQVILGMYSGGTWSQKTIWTLADKVTRPVIMLSSSTIYVAATAPESGGSSGDAGTIYQKTTSISSPSFASGKGTPVIRDADSQNLNNVTASKQTVNADSGLVWLATNSTTKRYWHSDTLAGQGGGGGGAVTPVASFTASPTSGTAPLAVSFTDTSTNTPTSWSWNFGDNSTSTAQNPSHTYTAAGTYDVTLTATNSAGSGTSTSRTITVTTGGGGGGTGTAAFVGASSAAVTTSTTATSVTVSRPAGVTSGDTLLAAVSSRGTPTISAPTGWTQVLSTVDSTTSRSVVFSHVATGTEPASYPFTFSKAQAAAVAVSAYRGVSGVGASAGQANASSASITAPSVSATSGDVLVGFFATARAGTVTPPSGMTERAEANTPSTSSKTTIEAADSTVTSTGGTGSKVATASGASANIGQLVVLSAG